MLVWLEDDRNEKKKRSLQEELYLSLFDFSLVPSISEINRNFQHDFLFLSQWAGYGVEERKCFYFPLERCWDSQLRNGTVSGPSLVSTHWSCRGVLMIIPSLLLPGKPRHRKAKWQVSRHRAQMVRTKMDPKEPLSSSRIKNSEMTVVVFRKVMEVWNTSESRGLLLLLVFSKEIIVLILPTHTRQKSIMGGVWDK